MCLLFPKPYQIPPLGLFYISDFLLLYPSSLASELGTGTIQEGECEYWGKVCNVIPPINLNTIRSIQLCLFF